MFQAVLFDLDGTLLDRDASLLQFIHDQYERFSVPLQHIAKETYVARFIELDAHGYVWKDKVYAQLIDEFQLPFTADTLLADYIEQFPRFSIPFPHVHDVLQSLKRSGVKLGIITNGFTHFQMRNIDALNIAQYFHTIVVSEAVNMRKPDPNIFMYALAQLHVDAANSVFIGDHVENDVRAAQQVGMTAIWKTVEPKQGSPYATLTNYEQLPALLHTLKTDAHS